MNKSYLFDTNAFFKLPILGPLQYHDISISPYVFWERFKHLSKAKSGDMKREFQRFSKVKMLDDPDAMIKRLLLPDNVGFQERTPDSVFIRQALVALGAAATLEQFCASIIEDVHGQPHSIRNCADEVLRDKKRNCSPVVRGGFEWGPARTRQGADFVVVRL